MKQVVFAIALLAMASLTGCLNGDDSPVDENIDTTDDSTSDTTEDNSDTTDDTKDDELIEPVGQTGDTTIPEDSSIFMDSLNVGNPGKSECSNPLDGDGDGDYNGNSDDDEDVVCTYTYHDTDYFENNYNNNGEFTGVAYYDADGIGNSISYTGWVNKTGERVTIENLYYPNRGIRHSGTTWEDINDDGQAEEVPYFQENVNDPVRNTCAYNYCYITFYGVNNLEYDAEFRTMITLYSGEFAIDYNNDGDKDSILYKTVNQKHTVTFDLPFEPYGFSIKIGNGNDDIIHRIF